MDEIEKLLLEMDSRGFSEKTKKAYAYFSKEFLGFSKKSSREAKEDDVKRYIAHLIKDKGYTNVTANLAISALKFFFNKCAETGICNRIERPKREKSLPQVLSKEEVKRIIDSANNTKHKLVLKCMYGLPHTCWSKAWTYGTYRHYWGIQNCRQRRYTLTLQTQN